MGIKEIFTTTLWSSGYIVEPRSYKGIARYTTAVPKYTSQVALGYGVQVSSTVHTELTVLNLKGIKILLPGCDTLGEVILGLQIKPQCLICALGPQPSC